MGRFCDRRGGWVGLYTSLGAWSVLIYDAIDAGQGD